MPWTKYFPLDFFFAISRKEKEEILGVDRVVSVTEAATEKGKSQDVQAATESVFSGPALPQAFYRSFSEGAQRQSRVPWWLHFMLRKQIDIKCMNVPFVFSYPCSCHH